MHTVSQSVLKTTYQVIKYDHQTRAGECSLIVHNSPGRQALSSAHFTEETTAQRRGPAFSELHSWHLVRLRKQGLAPSPML